MEGRWTEMSPGTPPAVVVEEESADKVTVVLAAAAEESAGTLRAGPAGAGCVPLAAVEAEIVPAVAARGAAVAPAWIPGSWAGPAIQGDPGNLAAAGPGWEDPAAGRRETGQTAGLRLGNKGAGTVGALGMGLAVAPGTGGACGAADRAVPPDRAQQKTAEGGVAPGKESGRPVVLEGAGCTGFAAGLGGELGRVAHNMAPGPGSRSLLVPAVHKIPSADRTACHPCLQGYVLACPLDSAEDPAGRNPDQGNLAPAADLWEAPAATADCMDCPLHMVDLSFFPSDPSDQVAGS